MSAAAVRVIGGLFAAYGLAMLLLRGPFARSAARSHLAIARVLPMLYRGRTREPQYQYGLWRVLIIPISLGFLVFGVTLMINPHLGT
jgi:hypothetical protein